jgi:sulfoxide reductase catalytic subunit YedY
MYGEPLPKQNGSPIRLALPWKYGYKGPKAVIRIEFIDEQPATFWSDLQPVEYPFLSNVNPNVPHPRWSQASEKFILDDPMAATRLETKLFNGYAEWVGSLYPDEPRS